MRHLLAIAVAFATVGSGFAQESKQPAKRPPNILYIMSDDHASAAIGAYKSFLGKFARTPRAFVPAPKVTSSVVSLTPRMAPLALADKATLERVTAAAFGQRRKMLRSSLRTLGVPIEPLLAAAGIVPMARAEELSVAEFCALARALQKPAI